MRFLLPVVLLVALTGCVSQDAPIPSADEPIASVLNPYTFAGYPLPAGYHWSLDVEGYGTEREFFKDCDGSTFRWSLSRHAVITNQTLPPGEPYRYFVESGAIQMAAAVPGCRLAKICGGQQDGQGIPIHLWDPENLVWVTITWWGATAQRQMALDLVARVQEHASARPVCDVAP
jgi:hypothetical protein